LGEPGALIGNINGCLMILAQYSRVRRSVRLGKKAGQRIL
jgi:hypothetical protein